MHNEYMYGWEKLHNAVSSLALGTTSLQERLANAMMHSLDLIHEQNMPPELYERLGRVKEHFRQVHIAPANAGTIHASASRISDDDACEIAAEIVSLFNGQCEAYYRG